MATSATPARYGTEPAPHLMAAARAMFEGRPYATPASVASEVGVLPYWVNRWKREQGWKKAARSIPGLSAQAVEVANKFKTKMSDLSPPLGEAPSPEAAAKEVSSEFAVDIRSEVISRHRKEWAAPRKVAYEAMQQAGRGDVAGAFERAKLAKITAETLSLIQSGECRAFGISHDAKGSDGSTVVVVERGGSGGDEAAGGEG